MRPPGARSGWRSAHAPAADDARESRARGRVDPPRGYNPENAFLAADCPRIDVSPHHKARPHLMKAAPVEGSAPVAVPDTRRGACLDFLALTKPRVNFLILITTLIGFH